MFVNNHIVQRRKTNRKQKKKENKSGLEERGSTFWTKEEQINNSFLLCLSASRRIRESLSSFPFDKGLIRAIIFRAAKRKRRRWVGRTHSNKKTKKKKKSLWAVRSQAEKKDSFSAHRLSLGTSPKLAWLAYLKKKRRARQKNIFWQWSIGNVFLFQCPKNVSSPLFFSSSQTNSDRLNTYLRRRVFLLFFFSNAINTIIIIIENHRLLSSFSPSFRLLVVEKQFVVELEHRQKSFMLHLVPMFSNLSILV